MRTPWKSWLSLPMLGALACAASGCHSETGPGDPSGTVTESAPDVPVLAPAPAPVQPAPATADLAPQTMPPLETLKQDAAQAVGTIDQELTQVGQALKADASPAAPATVLDTVKTDVNQAVGSIDQKTRHTAAELEQVVKQAAGNLERDVRRQARELPGTVLQKAENLGKETLKGLRAPKTPVPPDAK